MGLTMSVAGGGRVLLLVACFGLAVTGPHRALAKAPAAPSKAVQTLYDEARAAYDRGDYMEAARLLESAYQLEPDPDLLWNLGRSYDKGGDLERALDAYRRFAQAARTPEEKRDAEEKLLDVRTRFARGWLTVRCEQPGAMVQIDLDDELPPPVIRRLLPAGEHWVTVSAPGMSNNRTRVTLSAGEETEINIKLAAAQQAGTVQESRPTKEGGGADLRTWGWVSLGLGAALTAGGATFLALGHADAAKVSDARRDENGVITGITRARALELSDSAEWKSAAGVGMLAAGGAGLVAGMTMLLVGNDRSDDGAVSFSPQLGGFAISGSF